MAQRMNEDVNKVLAMPDVQEKMEQYGAEDGGGSIEKFASFIKAEQQKWARSRQGGQRQVGRLSHRAAPAETRSTGQSELLGQANALQFAGRALGNFGQEQDLARHLEVGQLRRREVAQFTLGQRHALS